ncbi:MAG: hypothetical protein EZS28_034201 [Streblomastix strix]|uniref:Spt5 KOW domain-containing protein n=1 Tax=Streblomastix strix TaxID=222440 RepID=A0A5J4UJZ4_9EUKA|nr:MAG: hypothetical protein EZS28_034201 [Streblomastix strix]
MLHRKIISDDSDDVDDEIEDEEEDEESDRKRNRPHKPENTAKQYLDDDAEVGDEEDEESLSREDLRVDRLPIKEVVMLVQAGMLQKKANAVQIGDWVRPKRGLYKGDLGRVIDFDGGRMQWIVSLFPRIDYEQLEILSKNQQVKQSNINEVQEDKERDIDMKQQKKGIIIGGIIAPQAVKRNPPKTFSMKNRPEARLLDMGEIQRMKFEPFVKFNKQLKVNKQKEHQIKE